MQKHLTTTNPGARWMPADAWLAMVEPDDRPPLSYQRGDFTPSKGTGRVGRCGRPVLDQAAAEEAATLARELGSVRAAARALGIPHSSLLSAWRRLGITVQ